MTTQEYKMMRVPKADHDKIRILADRSNKPMARVLRELVQAVFQIAVTFESLNLEYETCVTDSTIKITVTGRNKLVTSQFDCPTSLSEKKVDAKIRKRLKTS